GFTFFAGYQKGHSGSTFGNDIPVPPENALFVNTENQDKTIDFSLFWRVWELLKEKFVDKDKLDAKALFYGAIDGMLAATGDPYTTFFSPKENKEFQEDLAGSFEGIGAEMALKDNILTIVTPLDDSPAKKAGLLPGDQIIKISDELTSTLSLSGAVDKIRGPRGTSVALTIFRDGEDTTREITVTRDIIIVKSVKVEMKEDGIAFIRLSQFGDNAVEEFQKAVTDLKHGDTKGIVLDLRNNPGGFLDAAVKIAGTFLPDKTVVVQEEDSNKKRESLRSEGKPEFGNIPIVVLINEGSASASEILAGALRENRPDVTLVGKKSFGKGSVQELIPVGKDTSVKITVAHWLTPNGNQINKVGISPDVEVGISKEDAEQKHDSQLERALEILKEKL
ncbi:MAG: S41 family peptidase, partial [Candidatus Moraniibacteriota bacterium]